MSHPLHPHRPRIIPSALLLLGLLASTSTCTTGSGDEPGDDADAGGGEALDITDLIFEEISADCADHANQLWASVTDLQRMLGFEASVVIMASADTCTLISNNIPNHDFDDPSAQFATDVTEVSQSFTIPRNPVAAASPTPLSQRTYNAVFLNGVPLDLLSAGCYSPDSPMADPDGNVLIGCREDAPWLLDPLGVDNKFGADAHNAHTQPDGSYHYHGNPMALFDDTPGPQGSPVIGFAADGFPVYGSYFRDVDGNVRKAVSGWTLKVGDRPSGTGDPGGSYDGSYVDDWEYTGAGDLDECNGMTVNGQYGYYVTDAYPWVMACHHGTPHPSFDKGGPGPVAP
ncbi:YHYH protein [Haliangium sp.]|uniref:YHYH protein n=1 Tax=Haliangium sp. TaxID=2663208 RepID=UPI003D0C49DC